MHPQTDTPKSISSPRPPTPTPSPCLTFDNPLTRQAVPKGTRPHPIPTGTEPTRRSTPPEEFRPARQFAPVATRTARQPSASHARQPRAMTTFNPKDVAVLGSGEAYPPNTYSQEDFLAALIEVRASGRARARARPPS